MQRSTAFLLIGTAASIFISTCAFLAATGTAAMVAEVIKVFERERSLEQTTTKKPDKDHEKT